MKQKRAEVKFNSKANTYFYLLHTSTTTTTTMTRGHLWTMQAYCCLWPHHVWVSVTFPEGLSTRGQRRCGCWSCLFAPVSYHSILFYPKNKSVHWSTIAITVPQNFSNGIFFTKWGLSLNLVATWLYVASVLMQRCQCVVLVQRLLTYLPEGKIKRLLVNFVDLVKTVTKMVTGCLRTMKSCHIGIRWLRSISS